MKSDLKSIYSPESLYQLFGSYQQNLMTLLKGRLEIQGFVTFGYQGDSAQGCGQIAQVLLWGLGTSGLVG